MDDNEKKIERDLDLDEEIIGATQEINVVDDDMDPEIIGATQELNVIDADIDPEIIGATQELPVVDNDLDPEIIGATQELKIITDVVPQEPSVYEARISNVSSQEIAEYEETYTNEINKKEEKVITETPVDQPTEKKSFINSVNVAKSDGIYIDYKIRLAGSVALFIALFTLTVFFLQGAFNVSSSTLINYNENSNLDYKVYLKPNDFYETEYLGKNKAYIANLIDYVKIDFRYNFGIERESNIQFSYDVIAKLTINDGASGSNYFEKEYVLLENKTASIENAMNYSMYEQVKIDYSYYNTLANNFKQQYGIETDSNLTVYLRVRKQNDIENASNSVDNSTMFVKIPLSEKSVNIELNYQDINNSNYIITTNDNVTDNIIFGILSVVSILIAIVIAIRLIRLLSMLSTKKSIYDKYVERLLNEYDRLIVENGTGPDLAKNNVIKISQFEELLDVRDNLKLPIMYYVVAKHTKCCFYIKHNRDLYLLTIKAVDLEEANNEKK